MTTRRRPWPMVLIAVGLIGFDVIFYRDGFLGWSTYDAMVAGFALGVACERWSRT